KTYHLKDSWFESNTQFALAETASTTSSSTAIQTVVTFQLFSARNQDLNLLECKVCYNRFDDVRRPRTLPCGHTFCTCCLTETIKVGSSHCPSCRIQHRSSAVTDFPINFMAEAFMKSLGKVETSTKREKRHQVNVTVRGISRRLKELKIEQENIVRTLIGNCLQTKSQMNKYETYIIIWKEEVNEIITQFGAMTNETLKNLEEEHSRLTRLEQEGDEDVKQLEAILGTLDKATSSQEAGAAIDETENYVAAAQNWNTKCQECFPSVNTIHTTFKLREIMKMLERMGSITATDTLPQFDATSSIQEKVDKIIGNMSFVVHEEPPQQTVEQLPNTRLTIDSLRSGARSVNTLLRNGQVLAIQEGEELSSAKISLAGEKMCLHHLQKIPLPPDAHIVMHSQLMKAIDLSSATVFLDLAWDGMNKGRLHIRLLSAHSFEWIRQFVAMCTGEWGPSYVNSHFVELEKGCKWERVVAGDYEYNNGKGGAAIKRGLVLSDWEGLYSVGTVAARWWGSDATATQFVIYTKAMSEESHPLIIGNVVSGMPLLKLAVSLSDVTQV
ncbi:Tripartite motif-containing protein 59-like 3, partial [Homarus americanus]